MIKKITSFLIITSSIIASNDISNIDLKQFNSKFYGKLDKYPITMYLSIDKGKVTGIYQYQEHKEYLSIDGTINESGNCILSELNSKGKITGLFDGAIVENDFVGTWSKPNKSKTYQFKLKKISGILFTKKDKLTIMPSQENTKQNYIIIFYYVIGGFLIIGFLYYLKKQLDKRKRYTLEIEKKEILNQANYDNINLNDNNELSKEEKGLAFENYVIKKFNPKRFKLLDKTSDINVGGVFAESSKNPDLLFNYSDDTKFEKKFAIECKYQSKINEIIIIAKEKSIENYRNYAKNVCEEVYIVLGLGGKAYDPKEIFIIPLKDLSSNIISYDKLKKSYNKSHMQYFWYDKNKHNLT